MLQLQYSHKSHSCVFRSKEYGARNLVKMKLVILLCFLCAGVCQSSFLDKLREIPLLNMDKPSIERKQEPVSCEGRFEGDMMIVITEHEIFEGLCSTCVCKRNKSNPSRGSFDCKDTCITQNPLPPLPGQPYCNRVVNNIEYIRRVNDTIKLDECRYCTCKLDNRSETNGDYRCFSICYGSS
ncbi:hypothetical protein KUTeg_021874 [Tegillarca granosa]|uniref:Uncharacterized protein n=1 Tax=Tegillarca granosa TaxID=220873 RepID=A0ABQ9EA41_TEGGR|nr:hypothetical protein KUTeg_021874 [Tegillarca granosa]